MINLISNSIKFTNFGSIILEVFVKERNDEFYYLKFSVKDTGIGIKSENTPNLFNPFNKNCFKNNQSGAGLGLSIVSDLTSKLGETVQFSSQSGFGTCFWFYIKQNKPSNEEHEIKKSILFSDTNSSESAKTFKIPNIEFKIPNANKSECENSIISPKKIKNSREMNYKPVTNVINNIKLLATEVKINMPNSEDQFFNIKKDDKFFNIILVDDENLTRLSTKRVLNKASCELDIPINIIEAEDGIECIHFVNKYIKLGIKISFIYSNQNMGFVDGIECSKILMNIYESKNVSVIPFYLITAYEDSISIKKLGENIGIQKVFVKPIKTDIALSILTTNCT